VAEADERAMERERVVVTSMVAVFVVCGGYRRGDMQYESKG